MKVLYQQFLTFITAGEKRLVQSLFGSFVLGAVLVLLICWPRLNAVDEINQQLLAAQQELTETIQELATADVQATVQRQSQLQLRKMLDEQYVQIAEQEKALEFYRALMNPSQKKQGLELNSYTIEAGLDAETYDYRLSFVQYAKKHRVLALDLTIAVIGHVDGKPQTLDWQSLSLHGEQSAKLRFKYFQIIEGSIRLPDGFEPKQVVIKTVLEGKPWQREFDWPTITKEE